MEELVLGGHAEDEGAQVVVAQGAARQKKCWGDHPSEPYSLNN